ncbi:MAG TPA: 2Fe-2S iron-sulfur cluster-binding protein [Candidatus Competibacteraceae bacterium]|nr:2Fe-2S iron-sulfur cluster-binding protein [Candidatus Competibacteraceae bacterium]
MATDKRLPPQPREWIDRNRPLRFSFEGREYTGFAGDTVTSALLANGQMLLGRSFKYHRPRGVLSAANHDVNAMLQTADATNIRGDVTRIADGQAYSATNTRGGLARDRWRFLQHLAPLLPVGFYYKAFHTPKRLFPFWEKQIRALAGLGTLDTRWPREIAPKRYGFCDVLVIGAGPSGLAAAIAAAEAGAQVVLVDENPRAGGSLDYQFARDTAADAFRREALAKLERLENLEWWPETVAIGYYADHWVPLLRPAGIVKMRARAVIVAGGVFEQPAVFRNNDLPGVMLATAAQRLLHRYAVKPCERAVLLAGNEDGYRAALDLHSAGIAIAALVDLESAEPRGALAARVKAAGITLHGRHTVYEALAKDQRLAGVRICALDAEGRPRPDSAQTIACDGLLMSVGWAPAAALLYQAGARFGYAAPPGQFVPLELPAGVYAAGRVNGVFALAERILDGRAAGLEAAAFLGLAAPPAARPARAAQAHSHPYPIFSHPKGKNFVDFDEDLQLADLENAAREGFDNIELLKRYSTVGMGPSQGKHSNMNAIRILARATGRSIDATGTTTARPFFHPVPLKHLAGRRFRPERRSPLHAWHQEYGVHFMEAGDWLRPQYYGWDGLSAALRREVEAVRQRVGLIDVSTLGKIEVFGRDAAEFLDRLYTLRIGNLKEGMTRYTLMVDESGVVIDDGIAARLGPQRFYVTTTSGNAGAMLREMQRHLAEWGLEVDLIDRTGRLGAMNLAGPRAREVLAALTELDLAPDAFPFLGVRRGHVAGVPALLMRVGFVGELGYEIHVPASQARHVWEQLMKAGSAHGIAPFGVEAQRVLRLEKGHIIVGQDTDGLTTPFEAALDWAVHAKKPFFVGKRSLQILKERTARRLVGFALPAHHVGPLPKECHLVIDGGNIAGRVTSSAFSPTLGCHIGLAMVEQHLAAAGGSFTIRVDGGVLLPVSVVPVPFYDPQNERQQFAASLKEVAA